MPVIDESTVSLVGGGVVSTAGESAGYVGDELGESVEGGSEKG